MEINNKPFFLAPDTLVTDGTGDGGGTTEPTESSSSNPTDYPWYVSLSNWVTQSISSALSVFEGGLGSVFSNIGNAIQDLADGVALQPNLMAGVLDDIFGFVQPALTSIGDKITGIIEPIVTAVEGIVSPIVSGIWNSFSTVLDGMSWLLNSTYEVVRGIPDLITSIIDLITSLVDYINPFSPNFFIKIAFIPSDGFFTYYVSEHFSNIMNSFWVVQLYTSVTDQLKELAVYSPKPIFQVNLPAKYGGTTVNVIDFSFYDEYRDYIHLFIKVGAWLFFIKSLVRRAPQIIYK